MCISPVTLKRQYRTITGDFTDSVPCGKCFSCLKRRAADWSFRIEQEQKVSQSSAFITLTYETTPKTQTQKPTLRKRDLQLYHKRLRKKLSKFYGTSSPLKYYACGEYGTQTQRPHYHEILLNLPKFLLDNKTIIQESWQHGIVTVDKCEPASIRYVTNYVLKKSDIPTNNDEHTEKPFSLMSKNLGLDYLTPQMIKHHKEKMFPFITKQGGQLQPLPRYYMEKIFTKAERRQLAEDATLMREYNFSKYFNDDYKREHFWKKDQIRKSEKSKSLERNNI